MTAGVPTHLGWAIISGDEGEIDRSLQLEFPEGIPANCPLVPLSRNIDTVDYLCSRGAKLWAANPKGVNILMAACQIGDVDFVRTLIERGGQVNSKDFSGRSPLHFAASYRFDEIAALLLDHGAFVDIQDSEGKTALRVSAENGSVAVFRLLLKYGANPRIVDGMKQSVGAYLDDRLRQTETTMEIQNFRAMLSELNKNADGTSAGSQ
jgi:ankyrin repeat protein